MGQNKSITENNQSFSAEDWIDAIEDNETNRFTDVNPYRKRLLMNKATSELVEEY